MSRGPRQPHGLPSRVCDADIAFFGGNKQSLHNRTRKSLKCTGVRGPAGPDGARPLSPAPATLTLILVPSLSGSRSGSSSTCGRGRRSSARRREGPAGPQQRGHVAAQAFQPQRRRWMQRGRSSAAPPGASQATAARGRSPLARSDAPGHAVPGGRGGWRGRACGWEFAGTRPRVFAGLRPLPGVSGTDFLLIPTAPTRLLPLGLNCLQPAL